VVTQQFNPLCCGWVGFVYGFTSPNYIQCLSHTVPDWGIPRCCIVKYYKVPDAVGTIFSVKQLSEATLETLASSKNCADKKSLSENPKPNGMTWGNAFADAGAGDGTCAGGCQDWFAPLCKQGKCRLVQCHEDAKQYCGDDSHLGNLARWNCPETCGCDNFQFAGEEGSKNVMVGGCPSTCFKRSHFMQKQNTMPCKDFEKGAAGVYAKSVLRISEHWSTNLRTSLAGFADRIVKDGCGGIMSSANKVMQDCGAFYGGKGVGPTYQSSLKPLSNVCPVSCRCIKGAYGCPNTCDGTE